MFTPQRYSLALDGNVLDGNKLSNVVELEHVLMATAELSNMRVLNFSVSFIEEDLKKLNAEKFEDEGGVSLQALISTSHIAIHCWPNRNLFMFDLVSCRPFVPVAVASYLIYALSVDKINHCQIIQDCINREDSVEIILRELNLARNYSYRKECENG